MADTNPVEHDTEAEGIPDLEAPPPAQGPTGDLQDAQILPHDHALSADEHGTTVEEQRRGEPHDRRLLRDEADVLAPLNDSTDVDEPLDEESEARRGARRLVGTDNEVGAPDDEQDEVATEVNDHAGLSAEEAAVRVEEGF